MSLSSQEKRKSVITSKKGSTGTVVSTLASRGSRTSKTSKPESRGSQRSSSTYVSQLEPIPPKPKPVYQFKKYPLEPKPTLEDYLTDQLKDTALFPDVLTLDVDDDGYTVEKGSVDKSSILVTGFGMRNLESLQDALRQSEKERLIELYKKQEGVIQKSDYEKLSVDESVGFSSVRSSEKAKISTETETELSTIKSGNLSERLRVEYLMGLRKADEEEEEHEEMARKLEDEEELFVFSTSTSTKDTQKYFRIHRIFDFFQFITAHLLSATPENPIVFILELLNKCLVYRSSMGNPPLLYEKKHIAQLFNLMDRMKSGVVDFEQYKQGMTTLGICEYNKTPPLTDQGGITKEVFINEVYEAELALFDDLIKRKWIHKRPKPGPGPFDVEVVSQSMCGSYFIPSELLKPVSKKANSGVADEG